VGRNRERFGVGRRARQEFRVMPDGKYVIKFVAGILESGQGGNRGKGEDVGRGSTRGGSS